MKRQDLADKVCWASRDIGDGLGFDILSYEFTNGGNEKQIYIEVKTTTGGINKPFNVTINEVEFSKEYSDTYYVYRVYSLDKNCSNVKYYKIPGSISNNFDLYPVGFIAVNK